MAFLSENLAKKLAAGYPVVLGVTGGSISANTGSNGEVVVYVDQVARWLSVNYPPSHSRTKNGVTFDQHLVLNAAVAGTESDTAALCLDTMFSSLKPDVLFIEFAYNDAGMRPSRDKDTAAQDAAHPAANYERIIRQALAWETSCIIVEFAAIDQLTYLPRDSAGSAHAAVGLHYGVPIVDYAYFLATYPQSSEIQTMFYRVGEYIHPTTRGHALAATLIIQELLLGTVRSTAGPRPDANFQSSWKAGLPSSYHGGAEKLLENVKQRKLPLPLQLFTGNTSIKWTCYSGRLQNDSLIRNILTNSFAWPYGADVLDVGPYRSTSHQGFYTATPGAFLTFRLDPHVFKAGLLYRRSWASAGTASVWISSSPEIASYVKSDALLLDGTWSQQSTQMVSKVVHVPANLDGAPLYLHCRFEAVPEGVFPYFKVYGVLCAGKDDEQRP